MQHFAFMLETGELFCICAIGPAAKFLTFGVEAKEKDTNYLKILKLQLQVLYGDS